MYKLEDIRYETKDFWVLQVSNGYEVYRTGITCSTRVCQVGLDLGLDRAIWWADMYQEQEGKLTTWKEIYSGKVVSSYQTKG